MKFLALAMFFSLAITAFAQNEAATHAAQTSKPAKAEKALRLSIRMIDAEPETYLRRMNRVHALFVRTESSTPGVAELVLE